ncbi:MAG: restriction endonuclease subunit S [Allomuricauda sp.]
MSRMVKEELENLIDFKNGKKAPSEFGNIPIYGGNGVLGYTNKWNFENTLIVGRVGAYCGSINIVEGKCWVSDNAIAASPKDKDSLKYFYYLLGELNLNKKQIGSSQPLLTQGILNNISAKIHKSDKEQKQIAKVLSDLDAKIETNNKINAELEAMAKLIYDYWFVQFDFPFDFAQGKPDVNGQPYKSSGGKMVYNEQLKREIPEGWTSNTMADWIENDANGDWGKSEPEGNYNVQVNCIRGADLPSLDGFKTNESPTRYIHKNKTHKILKSNDLIIEISGGSPTQSTGRISFVTEETFKRYEAPLICSNFCKVVRLKEPKNLYIFYYTWKEAFEQGNMFNYEGKTSGIRNLLFSSLVESFKVPIPETGLVEKFYDFMKPIQKQKQRNLLENQKLAELRDWLLPMLMNGQVTVREAEEQLGMVAEENGKYGKG